MVEFRSLREDELEKWFDHCMYVFNGGTYSETYRQYFKDHLYNDPWKDIDSIFVAVDGDRIVSTVRLFHREVYIMGEKVKMGGIGEVSTLPEFQGQGYAGSLLSMAIDKMKKLDVKFSLLFSGHWGFYRKFGWMNCPTHVKVSEVPQALAAGYTIDRFDDKDFDAVKKIYDKYSIAFNGPVVRNDYYWDNWLKPKFKQSYILKTNDDILGYMLAEENDSSIVVKEVGLESGGLFDIFISGLCSSVGRENCEVKYSSAIKSRLKVKRIEENSTKMIMLTTPFTSCGVRLENTQELIRFFCGRHSNLGEDSFLFWDEDGF